MKKYLKSENKMNHGLNCYSIDFPLEAIEGRHFVKNEGYNWQSIDNEYHRHRPSGYHPKWKSRDFPLSIFKVLELDSSNEKCVERTSWWNAWGQHFDRSIILKRKKCKPPLPFRRPFSTKIETRPCGTTHILYLDCVYEIMEISTAVLWNYE